MDNNTQGTIWNTPAQLTLPDSDYAQPPLHLSFAGRIKASRKVPDAARPLDPAKRTKSKGADWPRPVWTPVPQTDDSLHTFCRTLSDGWKFCIAPEKDYWLNEALPDTWDDVPVPAELMALGYDIRRDREYVYKKKVTIPADWKGRTILLKFGMVYEYAKIWVNGQFMRDHDGAFTSFECDITSAVTPGQDAWVTVMCMHRHDALSDWPAIPGDDSVPVYAGLIDDVILLSLPQKHLGRFICDTSLDDAYTNAVVKITAMRTGSAGMENLSLHLYDPDGNDIFPKDTNLTLEIPDTERTLEIPVAAPLKWDAEHPNLYHLQAVLADHDGQELSYSIHVGFRTVERKGNHLYVNGMKTKLRGAALYGHDPILGKVFSHDSLEKIVRAAKWANINYFRTAAYPERAYLYDLCDRYGIYVQECAAVNFQRGTWDSQNDAKIRPTSNMPAYTAKYMNPFAEMIERDRNHPSVIIWEYGNESDWGINFQAELDYLKKEDPSRLTAGTWDNSHTDLASYHYPEYDEIIPTAAVYDEYVHLATHDMNTLRRDPGMRNAWGLSIKKGWDALYDADGVVGCAIFAMGDYYIERPAGDIFAASYGQWGLVDAWRREKPELWLARKSYSPVRLPDKRIDKPYPGMPLAIWVRNRYNHTSLNRILFRWHAGEDSGEFWGPDVGPGHGGAIIFPVRNWKDGEYLSISVYEESGFLTDHYHLLVGSNPRKKGFSSNTDAACEISQDAFAYIVSGKDFKITFSKETGLITECIYHAQNLIKSGPYLNLYGTYYKASVFQNDGQGAFGVRPSGWKCDGISCHIAERNAIVEISGTYPGGNHLDKWQFEYGYDPVHVLFRIAINGDGILTTTYTIHNPPSEYILEAGVSYILSDDIDRLTWDREAVFSGYPEDHIGRPSGVAYRYRENGKDTYRTEPSWSWSQDETNYALYGGLDTGNHGTNDFIAARENIYFASAILSGRKERVRVEADGKSVSVRLCPSRDEDPDLADGIKLTINNELYYDLGNGSGAIVRSGDGYLGNYTYPEVHLDAGYTASAQMRLTDNDEYDL